ncbi:MAG: putative hydrolase [Pelosinus sp.]|jgi:hypothetical protein|nr:putative hydrolase [Pelosinus sp.]
MSNFLYGRKYRILVSKIDNTALDVSNLRCTFRIEKVALQIANYAEICIYNLSAETEAEIIKEGDRVILEAGYQGIIEAKTDGTPEENQSPKQYGKIFDGLVVQALRDREDNIDYKLTLICMDGDDFLANNLIKLSIGAGQNHRQIVEQIVSKAERPTEIGKISPDLNTQKLPRGKVFFGTPKQYLKNIANDNNANFWVDDGQVYIAKATDIPSGQALVLTPKTGLIGTPQQTQDGASFKCLLNPSIKLLSMIKLDNTYIRQVKQQVGQLPTMLDSDGQYQVYKLSHYGDTRGDEWYTECEGMARNGKNALTLLSAPTQNPN